MSIAYLSRTGMEGGLTQFDLLKTFVLLPLIAVIPDPTPPPIYIANKELAVAEQWFNCNKLTINAKKAKYILFQNPNTHSHVSDLIIGGSTITRVGQTCPEKSAWFLGILIGDLLSFSGHIDILKAKLNSALYALSTCNKSVPIKIRKTIYSSLFESHLRFGSISFGAASKKLLEPISVIQRKALRLVARASYNAHSDVLFKHHNFLKYDNIIHLHQCIFMRQYFQLPLQICSITYHFPSKCIDTMTTSLFPK